MRNSTIFRRKYFWLSLFFSCTLSGEQGEIDLKSGYKLTAEILQDKPDRVHVDLGFTVLAIPREFIDSIRPLQESQSTVHETPDLYREGDTLLTPMPVRKLVEKNGNGVVTVQTPVGLGSGFIIHPEGYIITNDHVVAGETRISVTVFSGEARSDGVLNKFSFENVRIVATSAEWDLALLKIEGVDLPDFQSLPLGDSYDLREGEHVFAIGNPLGLERSVSEGIVSLRNRPIGSRLYIQTTTQINPGNSGGPLFNLKGEVVGVNNMKVMAQGTEGLGFSIPVSLLKEFLRNRDAFAFDPRNPNNGFRYNKPPSVVRKPTEKP
jgi:serine protease Do